MRRYDQDLDVATCFRDKINRCIISNSRSIERTRPATLISLQTPTSLYPNPFNKAEDINYFRGQTRLSSDAWLNLTWPMLSRPWRSICTVLRTLIPDLDLPVVPVNSSLLEFLSRSRCVTVGVLLPSLIASSPISISPSSWLRRAFEAVAVLVLRTYPLRPLAQAEGWV